MKTIHVSLLVVPCLLAVAACTVGPNYQRPSTGDITPKDWHWKEPASATRPATAPAPTDGAWWKVFADAQLDALESDVLDRNQNLIAAIARIEQSRAMARETQSASYPQLSGGASWNRSQSVMLNQSMLMSTYSIPFDLSYEVDLWGKIRRSYESANARTQVSEGGRTPDSSCAHQRHGLELFPGPHPRRPGRHPAAHGGTPPANCHDAPPEVGRRHHSRD
jgi:outer membrane protein TolC